MSKDVFLVFHTSTSIILVPNFLLMCKDSPVSLVKSIYFGENETIALKIEPAKKTQYFSFLVLG